MVEVGRIYEEELKQPEREKRPWRSSKGGGEGGRGKRLSELNTPYWVACSKTSNSAAQRRRCAIALRRGWRNRWHLQDKNYGRCGRTASRSSPPLFLGGKAERGSGRGMRHKSRRPPTKKKKNDKKSIDDFACSSCTPSVRKRGTPAIDVFSKSLAPALRKRRSWNWKERQREGEHRGASGGRKEKAARRCSAAVKYSCRTTSKPRDVFKNSS